MSKIMDSAIKLFGKTIALGRREAANINESSSTAKTCTFNDDGDEFNCDADIRSWNSSLNEEIPVIGIGHEQGDEHKEYSGKVLSIHIQEDDASHQIMQEPEPPAVVSDANENPKATSTDREISSTKPSNSGGQGERGSFQERTLKKPDKILPCPRCHSMNTKFCYYNNYNVNQPRHLCKICQRYWTAGGSLRNVPVGAGRRKTRSSSASSNFRQLIASGTSPTAHLDFASGVYNGTLGNIATVPPFNSDAPLCNSMASVLKLAEKTYCGEDQSSGSSITASCSSERRSDSSLQESVGSSYHGFPTQVTCVPRPPWSYPLLNKEQWTSAVPTAFCPPVFPASSHPAPAYWGCTVPSSWSVPCLSPSPSSFNQCFSSSGLNSPTLGKHSRDGDVLNQPKLKKESAEMDDHIETCVLVPKTLSINDPTEAAKSSIWTTLGIRNDKGGSSHSGGLFKGLQSTSKDKNHVSEPSLLLQANPAALSRSLDFHERS